MLSDGPPAANGTDTFTGRCGQDCANALCQEVIVNRAASNPMTTRLGISELHYDEVIEGARLA
jgi:hypothetical protein